MTDNTLAVRNNNPGNLIPPNGQNIWPGQIGVDSNGFAVFNSYQAGVNAANSNLSAYANRGWNTPAAIASHWSTTDQQAYINNIASAVGSDPNQTLDLSNPQVRSQVLGAIFQQEDNQVNASNPLSSIWGNIQTAVQTGDPLTIVPGFANAISGTVNGIATNVSNGVSTAVNSVGSGIGNIMNFNLGTWLENQVTGTAKQYLLPAAVGIGAVLFIMISSWGLVKDTPVGDTIKATGKAATGAILI